VNRLTDCYNAVSVLHQIPVGREDLTRYAGPAAADPRRRHRALRHRGRRVPVIEHPDPGEVVWCDDARVTCRRWNWRQARRTQLREDTTAALLILDALDPVTGEALHTAADDLTARLTGLGPDARTRPGPRWCFPPALHRGRR
jgi:DNA/RNA-binding domain of Phe-tRNA-synthetase-like protein